MKANSKKPNKYLTIIGLIIISFGMVIALVKVFSLSHAGTDAIITPQDQQIEEIKKAIKLNIDSRSLIVSQNSDGYDAALQLHTEDNKFLYAEWCGFIATSFLNEMKSKQPEIDKKIVNYKFEFINKYNNLEFTAVYSNSSEDQVKLAIKQKYTLLEAKTYEDYLVEKNNLEEYLSTHPYLNYYNPDGIKNAQPRTEADNIINIESSLTQFDHDYCLRYFLLGNAKLSVADNNSKISLTFKNTSKKTYKTVHIQFQLYNKDGAVRKAFETLENVKAGHTYDVNISVSLYQAVSFKITNIDIYNFDLKPSFGENFTFN